MLGFDEIERVINVIYFIFWKCIMLKCLMGYGVIVFCVFSVLISILIKCIFCIGGVNFLDSYDYIICKSC